MFVEKDIELARLMFFICLSVFLFTIVLMVYLVERADAPVAKLPEYKMEPVTTITARP